MWRLRLYLVEAQALLRLDVERVPQQLQPLHSDYTILWIFTEEQHGPGGGVVEAAGVHVRHLGEGEPGPLPGRGVISTMRYIFFIL